MLRFFAKASKNMPEPFKDICKDSVKVVVAVLIAKTGSKIFTFPFKESSKNNNNIKTDGVKVSPKN